MEAATLDPLLDIALPLASLPFDFGSDPVCRLPEGQVGCRQLHSLPRGSVRQALDGVMDLQYIEYRPKGGGIDDRSLHLASQALVIYLFVVDGPVIMYSLRIERIGQVLFSLIMGKHVEFGRVVAEQNVLHLGPV
jgi:hypothetical protein